MQAINHVDARPLNKGEIARTGWGTCIACYAGDRVKLAGTAPTHGGGPYRCHSPHDQIGLNERLLTTAYEAPEGVSFLLSARGARALS